MQMAYQRCFIHGFYSPAANKRLRNAIGDVHKLITKAAAVAQEITIHLAIEPVGDTT